MNEELLTEFRAMRTVLRDKSRTRKDTQACLDRFGELKKIYPWEDIYLAAEFVATELENISNE